MKRHVLTKMPSNEKGDDFHAAPSPEEHVISECPFSGFPDCAGRFGVPSSAGRAGYRGPDPVASVGCPARAATAIPSPNADSLRLVYREPCYGCTPYYRKMPASGIEPSVRHIKYVGIVRGVIYRSRMQMCALTTMASPSCVLKAIGWNAVACSSPDPRSGRSRENEAICAW